MQTLLNVIRSVDDGNSWSTPETILKSSEGSDHPLLLKNENGVFLSWHSDEHGYIFRPIESTVQLSGAN